jgi:hypothetical protein
MPWSRRKRISDERQEAGCKGLTNAKDLLLLLMLIFFGFSETFFHLGHFTGPAASFLKPQGILPEMVPTRDLQSCPQSCSICTHVTPRNSECLLDDCLVMAANCLIMTVSRVLIQDHSFATL